MEQIENKIFNSFRKYLVNLGYPAFSLIQEYQSNLSNLDAIVKSENKVLIVAEFKTAPINKIVSMNEIGFHPISRKLQREARDIGAKYYILTDGIEFIWLKTGSSGRPELIKEIRFSEFHANTLTDTEFTSTILSSAIDFIKNYPISGDFLHDVSLILYSHLVKERIYNSVSYQDFTAKLDHYPIIGQYIQDKNSRKNLLEILERFNMIDFSLVKNKLAVLEYIDGFIEKNWKDWTVPRWLSDFMVKLLELPAESRIIDLFGRAGTMLSSAHLEGYKCVSSLCLKEREISWIKVQHMLTSETEGDIIFDPNIINTDFSIPYRQVDAVLLAPPFNVRIHNDFSTSLGQQNVQDGTSIFIEKALRSINAHGRVLVIVPDNLLNSNAHRKTRAFLKRYIECIISLPLDTFKPYSSVKTSLLSLVADNSTGEVLFSKIEKNPQNDLLPGRLDNNHEAILNAIFSFRRHERSDILPQESFITNQIDDSDYSYSNYWLKANFNENQSIGDEYQLIPLRQMATILRGDQLVNDKNGDLAFIGPACVREFELKKEELSYTSHEKLPKKGLKKTEPGQVILNTIGNYSGKATIITEESAGLYVNRHIALLIPNRDIILPEYLVIALNSKFVQEQFYNTVSGVVIPALNLSKIDAIQIPLPNFIRQKEICARYDLIFDDLHNFKRKITHLESELGALLKEFGKRKEEKR